MTRRSLHFGRDDKKLSFRLTRRNLRRSHLCGRDDKYTVSFRPKRSAVEKSLAFQRSLDCARDDKRGLSTSVETTKKLETTDIYNPYVYSDISANTMAMVSVPTENGTIISMPDQRAMSKVATPMTWKSIFILPYQLALMNG